MTLELYKEVALTQDILEHQLKVSDVATFIDFVPHPRSGEPGCILEIFNAIGETIAVVAVPISAIKTLRADQVLSTHSLAST